MSMLTLSPRETWSHLRRPLISFGAIQQIVGRERRERVSQLAWCGGGCFDSRRRVNSTVMRLSKMIQTLVMGTLLLGFGVSGLASAQRKRESVLLRNNRPSVYIEFQRSGKAP